MTRSNELEVLEYCLCLNVHSFKSKVDNETRPVFLQVENEDGSAGKPDLGFGFDKKRALSMFQSHRKHVWVKRVETQAERRRGHVI